MSVRFNYKIFNFSFSISAQSSRDIRLFDLVYRNFRQKSGPSPSFCFEVFTDNRKRGFPHLKVEGKICPFHSFSSVESQCFKLITDEIYKKINSHVWMHGGGIAFQNKGIMVCGDSWTGKTSLILKLLSSGFKFLSDEVIPIDKKTGMMVPFPRSVGLRPEARALLGKEFSFFRELEFVNFSGHKYFANPSLLKSKRTHQPVFPEYFVYLTYPDSVSGEEMNVDTIIETQGEDFLIHLKKIKGLKVLKSIRKDNYVYLMTRIKRNASVIKQYLKLYEKYKKHIVHTEKKRDKGLKFNQNPRIRPLSFPDLGLFMVKQSKESLMEYNSGEERFKSLGAYWLGLLKELNLEKVKGFEVRVGRMEDTVELLQNLVR